MRFPILLLIAVCMPSCSPAAAPAKATAAEPATVAAAEPVALEAPYTASDLKRALRAGVVRELWDVRLANLDDDTMRELARLDPQHRVTFAMPEPVALELLRRMDATGLLRKVSRLRVDCGQKCAELLARSRHAGGLVELELSACPADELEDHEIDWVDTMRCQVEERAAGALGRSPMLGKLEILIIAIQDKAVPALLGGPLSRALRQLHLTTDSAGVHAVAASRHLGKLERLSVYSPGLTLDAVKALVRSPHLARSLRALSFVASDSEAEQTLGAEAMRTLAREMNLPALRELDVSWNHAGDDAVRELVAAPWLLQLEEIGLCGPGFGPQTRAELERRVSTEPWERLRHLCVPDHVASDEAITEYLGTRLIDESARQKLESRRWLISRIRIHEPCGPRSSGWQAVRDAQDRCALGYHAGTDYREGRHYTPCEGPECRQTLAQACGKTRGVRDAETRISMICAPDLDGDGTNDHVVRHDSFITAGDAPPKYCGTRKGRTDTEHCWPQSVAFAASKQGGTWKMLGGSIQTRYYEKETPGYDFALDGFVRLPDGRAGVLVRPVSCAEASLYEAACATEIRVLEGGTWKVYP